MAETGHCQPWTSVLSVCKLRVHHSLLLRGFLTLLRRVSRGDEELDTLIKATIAGGGVIPHIHKSLINKGPKAKMKMGKGGAQ